METQKIVLQIAATNDTMMSFLRVALTLGGAVAHMGHILAPVGKSNAHVWQIKAPHTLHLDVACTFACWTQ
jgi:hypothetical protein